MPATLCPIQTEKSSCFAQAALVERLWLNLFFLPVEQAMPASQQFYREWLLPYCFTILDVWNCRCAMQPYSYRVICIHVCVRTINYLSIMMTCLRSAIHICVRIISYSPIHIWQLALPSPRQLPRGSGEYISNVQGALLSPLKDLGY
jgi:hypothetical protein